MDMSETYEVNLAHRTHQAAGEERLAYRAKEAYPGTAAACQQESHQACREGHRGRAGSGAAWGWRVLGLQQHMTR